MKILFFMPRFAATGQERHIVNLVNGFSELGCDVTLLAMRGSPEDMPFPLCENIKVASIYPSFSDNREREVKTKSACSEESSVSIASAQTIPVKSFINQEDKKVEKLSPVSRVKKAFKRTSVFRKHSFQKNYRQYFEKEYPDIVIVGSPRLFERAYYAASSLGCKIFDAECNSFQYTFPKNDKHVIKALKKADGIIVQTQAEKQQYLTLFKRVFVINNPIVPGLPEPFTGQRKKQIVNFCRVSPQKNLELLIDAFLMLHQEYPEYSLCIYGNFSISTGQDQEYQKRIREKVKDQTNIKLLPARVDVHQVILDAAMFVSSSDYEGLSNSTIEAMAIGLPCVCTDCNGGGTREVMVDRENGLIVPMRDPEAMYRAMKEFIENPELAQKCAENAVKIREKLDGKAIASQWIDTMISAGETLNSVGRKKA